MPIPDMVIALRKKRMDSATKDIAPNEEAVESPKGDMAEYWQRLEDMEAKIDQILGLLQAKEAPEDKEEV